MFIVILLCCSPPVMSGFAVQRLEEEWKALQRHHPYVRLLLTHCIAEHAGNM